MCSGVAGTGRNQDCGSGCSSYPGSLGSSSAVERWFGIRQELKCEFSQHSSAEMPSVAALGASDHQSSSLQAPPALSCTCGEEQGGDAAWEFTALEFQSTRSTLPAPGRTSLTLLPEQGTLLPVWSISLPGTAQWPAAPAEQFLLHLCLQGLVLAAAAAAVSKSDGEFGCLHVYFEKKNTFKVFDVSY